jgi:foldase protein PrsA
MPKSLRHRIAAAHSRALGLALSVALLGVAGCGDAVPQNAVANVDGDIVKKSEFDHWLGAAAKGQSAQPGARPTRVVIPDPPEFRKCAAARLKQPQGRGAPKLNEAQARETCKQEYSLLKDQVMQFLISSRWVELEAEEQGVEAEPEEVNRTFEEQKKQSFPSDREYQAFLKSSGQTEADLKYRVKLDVLSNEVRKEIVGGGEPPTDAEVRDFYNKNREQFGQPEKRDLSVVLTKKEGEAANAKRALEGGQSFREVSRRYSIDEASKDKGGKLTGVAKGQQERALDDAVFRAKQGELLGPVKTQFGFYVFEVDKVTPGSEQSFEQSRETIKAQLRSQEEQKKLDRFVKDFQKKFRDKTNCAKGYTIYQCKNGPKQPPQQPGVPGAGGQGTAPGAGGGAPQGGPPPSGGGAPTGGGAPRE